MNYSPELVHPKLLLMMGYTTRLELVFEPVVLGSLHLCLHTHSIPFRLEEVALQVRASQRSAVQCS